MIKKNTLGPGKPQPTQIGGRRVEEKVVVDWGPSSGKVAVCCLLWQGKSRHDRKYTEEWVEKLYKMVKKNLPLNFDFYCFTNIDFQKEGIKVVQLDKNYPEWWGKMSYFGHPDLYNYDFCVCLDLDIFIVDSLLPMVDYYKKWDCPDIMCSYTPAKGITRSKGLKIHYMYQTSVFFFCPRKAVGLGLLFKREHEKIVKTFWGDQDWLAEVAPGRRVFPESYTMKIQIWQANGHDFKEAKVIFSIPDKNDVAVKKHPELLRYWG